jgi:hypothetical protein
MRANTIQWMGAVQLSHESGASGGWLIADGGRSAGALVRWVAVGLESEWVRR